jgi:hypothetical protein
LQVGSSRGRKKQGTVNIFFDILDTLLTEDGDHRPHAREVVLKLTELGHGVYLWSTAGEGYATNAAWVLGVENLVKGCFLKGQPPEGITVDYVVDDDEGMVKEHGGCVVRPYEGDPWDSELLGVLEAVEASELD